MCGLCQPSVVCVCLQMSLSSHVVQPPPPTPCLLATLPFGRVHTYTYTHTVRHRQTETFTKRDRLRQRQPERESYISVCSNLRKQGHRPRYRYRHRLVARLPEGGRRAHRRPDRRLYRAEVGRRDSIEEDHAPGRIRHVLQPLSRRLAARFCQMVRYVAGLSESRPYPWQR